MGPPSKHTPVDGLGVADGIPVCASDGVCELGMDAVDAVLGLGTATMGVALSVAVGDPVCRWRMMAMGPIFSRYGTGCLV